MNLFSVCTVMLWGVLLGAQVRLGPSSKFQRTSTTDADGNRWLSGPVLGYVVEESLTKPQETASADSAVGAANGTRLFVRAILGIPEASHYSEPIEPPVAARRIVFAPGHLWAIVFRDNDAPTVAWSPELGVLGALDEVTTEPDFLAFSPSGVQASLFWREGNRLLIYSVAPGEISLVRKDSALPWPDDVHRIAISDSGTALAGLTSSGNLLLIAGHIVPLYASEHLADVSFRPGSLDLVVADRGSERILLFEESSGGYASRVLMTATEGISTPDHIAATMDGVILASSDEAKRIWAINIITGAVENTEAETAHHIEALRLKGLFLLSAEPHQPGWLCQNSQGAPRVTFVPAVPKASPEAEGIRR
ncbi:MAG: hypothetical protein ACKV22_41360 [Bryobacteraceae bacterium]